MRTDKDNNFILEEMKNKYNPTTARIGYAASIAFIEDVLEEIEEQGISEDEFCSRLGYTPLKLEHMKQFHSSITIFEAAAIAKVLGKKFKFGFAPLKKGK